MVRDVLSINKEYFSYDSLHCSTIKAPAIPVQTGGARNGKCSHIFSQKSEGTMGYCDSSVRRRFVGFAGL